MKHPFVQNVIRVLRQQFYMLSRVLPQLAAALSRGLNQLLTSRSSLLRMGWGRLLLFLPLFPVPHIPDTLTTVEERANYATLHYWDDYNFADTTLLRPDGAEQAVVDYIAIAQLATDSIRHQGIAQWFHRASADTTVFRYFYHTAERYLYDPQSPLRNDALFSILLRVVPTTDEALTPRITFLRALTSRNNVGQPPVDFSCSLSDGRTTTLHQLLSSDVPTLLLFYDPDCGECQQMLFRLRFSSVINAQIANKQLQVIAVYAEGDRDRWTASLADLPDSWLKAFDTSDIKAHASYDLRAMPSLYLIGSNGHIALKDTDFHTLIGHLVQTTH